MNGVAQLPATRLNRLALRLTCLLLAILGIPSTTRAQSPPPTPQVSFEFASSYWGEKAGETIIQVRLSEQATAPVSVQFKTSNGTAIAPADYMARSGTVVFAPGETLKELSTAIKIKKDKIVEPTEDFQITLSDPSGATLGFPSVHTASILDDDDETPILSISVKKAAICAGAKDTAIHQTNVIATVKSITGGAQSGVNVTFSTTAGSLNSTSATTDSAGKATVTLTSSNLASDSSVHFNATITVSATAMTPVSANVEFQPTICQLSAAPDVVLTGEKTVMTFHLDWDAQNVSQHSVSYRISRIWDAMDNLVYDGMGVPPSGYGTIVVGKSAQTNGSGNDRPTFKAGMSPGRIEIEGTDEDVQKVLTGDKPKANGYVLVLASQTTPPKTKVLIANTSRGGDKVVVAKVHDLPGGEKNIEVTVTPKGATATLNIAKVAGAGGSAVFKDTGTSTTTVTGGDAAVKVTILGRDFSDTARNMEVQYKEGDTVVEKFQFTVIVMQLTPFVGTTETAAAKIPAAAMSSAGAGPDSLRDVYEANKPNKNFGFELTGGRNYGGIYFQGKIIPKGMVAADFGTGRANGFDGKRTISIREYVDECLPQAGGSGEFTQNEDDDASDFDEDLTPGADVAMDTSLYVHGIDIVQRGSAVIGANQKYRLRFNATEFYNYGGTRCSSKIDWYVAYSGQKDATGAYTQMNDAGGNDNKVGLGQIKLTPKLDDPAGQPPTDLVLVKPHMPAPGVPGFITAGDKGIAIEISGKNLKPDTCTTQAAFLLQDGTGVYRMEMKNPVVDAMGTKLTGTLDVPATQKKGKYKLLVFKDGQPAAELPDALEIKGR